MENLWLCFVGSHLLGGFRGGVAHHEVKRSRRGLTEARVAIEGNGYAYRGVLAGKFEATFEQAVVNLVDV